MKRYTTEYDCSHETRAAMIDCIGQASCDAALGSPTYRIYRAMYAGVHGPSEVNGNAVYSISYRPKMPRVIR